MFKICIAKLLSRRQGIRGCLLTVACCDIPSRLRCIRHSRLLCDSDAEHKNNFEPDTVFLKHHVNLNNHETDSVIILMPVLYNKL